jgi:hypothetical protein
MVMPQLQGGVRQWMGSGVAVSVHEFPEISVNMVSIPAECISVGGTPFYLLLLQADNLVKLTRL